ncbi:hypothetical protein ENSA5_60990 [Enhygromyxa salina]|uniref:UPF0235 protein ENSA5_60990 n=1 Tax=Enhygromyxa salina TaxID=215803 RepID=A0A2S9XDB1_9BACT|nr:DUF167 domain-containing protein [Enhygromyxa salina]PRP90849.1 hypothetical protein ENSA5_60990 [Enhygromyxa salina]
MLRVRPDGAVDLDLHAKPRSSRESIGKLHDGRLEIYVKAAPVDGGANAAIVKLLSKTLGVPRSAIELVRGPTGKRKTVRVTGLSRERIAAKLGLGLGLALTLAGASACESPRELPITVILPADTSDYERADNASLVMRPSGDAFSFGVDGLDFSLELEGEPSTSLQQLELYLADGDELLAWGSTVPFATAGADVGLALFLGRPGLLSTWPEVLDTPDPALLAAEAIGRGMLMVQADGDTFLLNHYSLALEAGSRLPDTVSFGADDGGLFSAADGAVVRMAWEQLEPTAWRYDPSADAWSELSVDGAAEIGARPGASVLVDPDRTRLYLLGGGGLLDGVAIDLLPDDDGVLAAAPVADLVLDAPRVGAAALWIATDDDPTADVLLVGGEEAGPLALLTSAGASVGPSLAWRDLACAIQNPGADAVTVLCLGGSIDGSPTADAASIEVIVGGSAEVEIRESFLPLALPDPLIFADDFALYAQGEARWLRIARDDASVSEPNSAPLRASGGHLASLANGVTFVLGGVDQGGVALDRWQVFTPAIEP